MWSVGRQTRIIIIVVLCFICTTTLGIYLYSRVLYYRYVSLILNAGILTDGTSIEAMYTTSFKEGSMVNVAEVSNTNVNQFGQITVHPRSLLLTCIYTGGKNYSERVAAQLNAWTNDINIYYVTKKSLNGTSNIIHLDNEAEIGGYKVAYLTKLNPYYNLFNNYNSVYSSYLIVNRLQGLWRKTLLLFEYLETWIDKYDFFMKIDDDT